MDTTNRTVTLEVLAGVYKGRQEERATLTHSYTEEAEKTLCGRIKADRLADISEDVTAPPTCERCRRKDPRFAK